MKRLGFCIGIILAVLVFSAHPQLQGLSSVAYAGGGGGGGGGAGDFSSSGTAGKKQSKFEIYAQTVEDNYRSEGMSYYFTRKSRMKRLLQRMYEEQKAGEKHILNKLKDIQADGLGLRDSRKYKPGWAFQVISALEPYTWYRDGTMTKAAYQASMKDVLGFVP